MIGASKHGYSAVALRIRALVYINHDSLNEVCNSIGISPCSVSAKPSIPRFNTVKRFADYYGVSTSFLFGWEEGETELERCISAFVKMELEIQERSLRAAKEMA